MAQLCLVCGDKTDLIGKFLVVGSALPDVVRKINCTEAIIYAVDVVLPIDIRYACVGFDSRFLIAVDCIPPRGSVYTARILP